MACRRFAAQWELAIESHNAVTWLVIGTALGWLSTRIQPPGDRVVFIETMVVGIFGSFIGGEFVATIFSVGAAKATISFGAVVLATGCSVAALAALALMRRAVGPLRHGRSKRRR